MTTAPKQDASPAKVERRSGGAIFLVAMGLALATTSGAILTAIGTGNLPDVVRTLSSPGAADTLAEQLRQTATVARLENDVRVLIDEISDLKARPAEARADPRIEEHLARLDSGLAQLQTVTTQLGIDTGELKTATMQLGIDHGELRAAQGELAAAAAHQDQLDDLKAGLAQAGIDLDAMRSSLDASDHSRSKEIVNIGQRVDRLEHLIGAGDATGSLGTIVHKRRGIGGQHKLSAGHGLSAWSAQEAQDGAAHYGPDAHPRGHSRHVRARNRAGAERAQTGEGSFLQR